MRIILTGTPGTGKTEVAPIVASMLSLECVSLREFVNRRRIYMYEGRQKTVDVRKLSGALMKELHGKRDYIVEGHLACEFRVPAELVVVLRTHPDVLKKRLVRRGYSRKKIAENMLAEMIDYCTQKSEQTYGKNVLELDTSRTTPAAAAKKLAVAIKKKARRIDVVDYSEELKPSFATHV